MPANTGGTCCGEYQASLLWGGLLVAMYVQWYLRRHDQILWGELLYGFKLYLGLSLTGIFISGVAAIVVPVVCSLIMCALLFNPMQLRWDWTILYWIWSVIWIVVGAAVTFVDV